MITVDGKFSEPIITSTKYQQVSTFTLTSFEEEIRGLKCSRYTSFNSCPKSAESHKSTVYIFSKVKN